MTVTVPKSYVALVKFCAKGTGLPYDVVAAQAYTESGFNANAISSAGAEGWLQFEPGTFASYGTGSPFNTWDEARAYVNFMSYLLHWSGGSVWKSLAAYNAGTGNWTTGIGYANTVLALAGEGTAIGTKPPPGQKTSEIAFTGTVQPDDWSYYISRASEHLAYTASHITAYTAAIRRL